LRAAAERVIVGKTPMPCALIVIALVAATALAATPERAELSISPGQRLSAILSGVDQQHDNQRPRIAIRLKKSAVAEKTLVLELTPEKHPDLAGVILGSFFWRVEATIEDLGGKQVARIGVYGRTGEDLMVMDEIAILIDVNSEPQVIWMGLGNREENRFDVCVIETRASFRLTKDGQLERRTRSVKHVNKVGDDDPEMAQYVRECKTPKRRVEMFPLAASQYGVAPDDRSPATRSPMNGRSLTRPTDQRRLRP
jgi:hypothetical protein